MAKSSKHSKYSKRSKPRKQSNTISVNTALVGFSDAAVISRPEIADISSVVSSEKQEFTATSIHLVRQFYKDSKQLTLFSDTTVDRYATETGLEINNRPSSYGVVMNDSQKRVFEGLLKAFSDSHYEGDYQVEKRDSLEDVYDVEAIKRTGGELYKTAYKNVDKVPVRRLTQSEIVRLAGYDMYRQGDKEDVVQALSFLGTQQFCFYWLRLAYGKDGKPERDKDGNWKKEEVMEVGTIFRIKVVKDEATGDLKYYEIHPSSVVVDQVNAKYGGKYFLLVPQNWRDEVKRLVGKRASRYTFEFLYWLRLQFEEIRRYNSSHKTKKPFVIRRAWQEIAQILKMPETLYIKNWKTAAKKIEEAYSVAKSLGYLIDWKKDGAVDALHLNENFYPKPGLQGEDEDVKRLKSGR